MSGSGQDKENQQKNFTLGKFDTIGFQKMIGGKVVSKELETRERPGEKPLKRK